MGSIAIMVEIQARPARRAVVDDVKPEHHWIDDKLTSWGRWARSRAARLRTGSAEGAYRAPWRQWHYPSIAEMMPPVPDPELRLIDRAVLHVPGSHQLALKLHYAFNFPALALCKKVNIRPNVFAVFMHDARAMALNNLRRLSASV